MNTFICPLDLRVVIKIQNWLHDNVSNDQSPATWTLEINSNHDIVINIVDTESAIMLKLIFGL